MEHDTARDGDGDDGVAHQRLAQALPHLLTALGPATGEDFLQAVVIEVARAIGAEIAFVGRRLPDAGEVQIVAMALDCQAGPRLRYELAGTASAVVLAERRFLHVAQALDGFPRDRWLREMRVRAFVGAPLDEADGGPGGLIVALYRDGAPDAGFARALFGVLAPRIGAELARAANDARTLARTAALERRVAERSAELHERNRDLEHFAHTVARDLRSPLGAIEGLAHAIEEDHGPQLPPEPRTQLARIRRHAGHARQIVLDLAHLSLAAVQPLRTGTVDVVPLFIEAVETLRPPTPAVVIEHPEQCLVEADPELIAILVGNLVSNAIKYAMRRAEIRVVLGSRPGCSFYVRDNGCGFPQSRAAEIFRPFNRLHDPLEYEGTGMGLAAVARIVARHAGRTWAEGEPGWGATVYVALPPAA